MTIGPEAMRRIARMSVRRGTRASGSAADADPPGLDHGEAAEQALSAVSDQSQHGLREHPARRCGESEQDDADRRSAARVSKPTEVLVFRQQHSALIGKEAHHLTPGASPFEERQ